MILTRFGVKYLLRRLRQILRPKYSIRCSFPLLLCAQNLVSWLYQLIIKIVSIHFQLVLVGVEILVLVNFVTSARSCPPFQVDKFAAGMEDWIVGLLAALTKIFLVRLRLIFLEIVILLPFLDYCKIWLQSFTQIKIRNFTFLNFLFTVNLLMALLILYLLNIRKY